MILEPARRRRCRCRVARLRYAFLALPCGPGFVRRLPRLVHAIAKNSPARSRHRQVSVMNLSAGVQFSVCFVAQGSINRENAICLRGVVSIDVSSMADREHLHDEPVVLEGA